MLALDSFCLRNVAAGPFLSLNHCATWFQSERLQLPGCQREAVRTQRGNAKRCESGCRDTGPPASRLMRASVLGNTRMESTSSSCIPSGRTTTCCLQSVSRFSTAAMRLASTSQRVPLRPGEHGAFEDFFLTRWHTLWHRWKISASSSVMFMSSFFLLVKSLISSCQNSPELVDFSLPGSFLLSVDYVERPFVVQPLNHHVWWDSGEHANCCFFKSNTSIHTF